MLRRAGFLIAALFASVVVFSGAAAQTPTAEKYVTISPTSGPPGTVVTAELFNAPPNDPITVIFQIPGDPIVATGTTDATGYAKFTFTVPYTPGAGTWPIFFTDFKCDCQLWANFTILNVRPTNTPVPTVTPTRPPATPTVPGTQAPTQTATPTATSTPAPPVLGSTSSSGGPGPNIGILALGFMAVITVLSWFAATRGPRPVMAEAYSRDDYSTELDDETLASLRHAVTPVAPAGRPRGRGAGWAMGAGLGAIAGLFLLRRK